MLKQILLIILFVMAGVVTLYFFQPLKKVNIMSTADRFERVAGWPQLPAGVSLGNPTGVGIDTNQNIILFHRAGRDWPWVGAMPAEKISDKTILVLNRITGKVINSWGNDLFIMPHGLAVDKDNHIWVTDVGLHQVFKFSYEGKLLLVLGEAGVAGSDSLHFNKPTDIAVAADGSFYVSDGYGNSRIIKFSPAGKYLFEWGTHGGGTGEFKIPHAVTLDAVGNVWVADRENNRIQCFDAKGKFLRQYTDENFGNMGAVAFDGQRSSLVAVDDISFLKLKHRGSDVILLDTTGKVQARFGRSGSFEGNVSWYHDLAVDRDGNMYVCDILGNTIQKFSRKN